MGLLGKLLNQDAGNGFPERAAALNTKLIEGIGRFLETGDSFLRGKHPRFWLLFPYSRNLWLTCIRVSAAGPH